MKYHKKAKTNEHIRRLIQGSREPVRSLALKLHLSVNTVQKWRKAGRVFDKSSRPLKIEKSLTKIEERVIVSVRKHLKLSLDDTISVLSRYIANLNRANCYRTFKAYHLSVLPKPFQPKGKFSNYPAGFLHLDLAYLPFLGGRSKRRYLLVAIDRTTKLAFIMIVGGKSQIQTIRFLHKLIQFYPYRVRWILTDNGTEVAKRFTLECTKLGIKHRKTKVKHPWTNGMAETTIKRIKNDTIWKVYYQNDGELERDLINWLNTYNFKAKLKSLKGLTPYEKVLDCYHHSIEDQKEDSKLKGNQELRDSKPKVIFDRELTSDSLKICTITL